MEGESVLQLAAIVVLLGLSAFFSASETALMACNKIRMKNLSDNGDRRAATVLKVTENQPKMLSAILIDRLKTAFDWIKRHYSVINTVSGGFLILVGVLMATGLMGRFLNLLS